jgi:hypothetical protein
MVLSRFHLWNSAGRHYTRSDRAARKLTEKRKSRMSLKGKNVIDGWCGRAGFGRRQNAACRWGNRLIACLLSGKAPAFYREGL